jgi:tRNA nucleotidyltransferase (CCA-adding enzyme)
MSAVTKRDMMRCVHKQLCKSSFSRTIMSSGLSYTNFSPRHRALLSSDSPTIDLSDAENRLCRLLDEFTQQLRAEKQVVECCIAGGWVRDKVCLSFRFLRFSESPQLLGQSSNDIDIALSSMMGFPFAVQFSQFLESRSIPVTRVTKVESRAEQSKHLETAKVAVLGLDLDFVNLRSEVYAKESRIPTKVVRILYYSILNGQWGLIA